MESGCFYLEWAATWSFQVRWAESGCFYLEWAATWSFQVGWTESGCFYLEWVASGCFLLGVGSHLVISSRVGRKWVFLLGSGQPLGHFK